ncbi:MAG TPA: hypothetical protein VFI50_09215, partial [Casimicrobiaceae bacterium]|nr:hypothetical protein [Casimicrobiaceae bacterium]
MTITDHDDVGVALWNRHFREPERAFEEASQLQGADTDPGLRAWCELTIAYHHLYFTPNPLDAGPWLERAAARFEQTAERRGSLLAQVGAARLAITERDPIAARERLLALYAESQQVLAPEDRFWLLNAIGAAHYFTDRLDEAIRYLYEALETLRDSDPSPQHPTIMSNLAAARERFGQIRTREHHELRVVVACEAGQRRFGKLLRGRVVADRDER